LALIRRKVGLSLSFAVKITGALIVAAIATKIIKKYMVSCFCGFILLPTFILYYCLRLFYALFILLKLC